MAVSAAWTTRLKRAAAVVGITACATSPALVIAQRPPPRTTTTPPSQTTTTPIVVRDTVHTDESKSLAGTIATYALLGR